MIFSKLFLALLALIKLAASQPLAPVGPIGGCAGGAPIALACDTDPTTAFISQKATAILEDLGVTVTLSIECQGALANAALCIGPTEDGAIGVVVVDDSNIFDNVLLDEEPLCFTAFFIEDRVKRYKSICRGRDFRIIQILDIDYNTPTRNLRALIGN